MHESHSPDVFLCLFSPMLMQRMFFHSHRNLKDVRLCGFFQFSKNERRLFAASFSTLAFFDLSKSSKIKKNYDTNIASVHPKESIYVRFLSSGKKGQFDLSLQPACTLAKCTMKSKVCRFPKSPHRHSYIVAFGLFITCLHVCSPLISQQA